MEVWNQVFRIRYGPRPREEESSPDKSETIHVTPPSQPSTLALNLSNYSGGGFDTSDSGESDSEGSEEAEARGAAVGGAEKPGSLAKGDWEKFQSKVSRQLLARYFYSCESSYTGP